MVGIENIVRFNDDKRSRNPLDSTIYTKFNINTYFKLCFTFDYDYYPINPVYRK